MELRYDDSKKTGKGGVNRMGIMSRLAAKGLLRNRRRTLLTVLGISVTVALLSLSLIHI